MQVALLVGVVLTVILSATTLLLQILNRPRWVLVGQTAPTQQREPMRRRIAIWVLAGLGAALLPLGTELVARAAIGQGWLYKQVLSSGELVLVTVILTIAAIGDFVIRTEGRTMTAEIGYFWLGTTMTIVCGALLYGVIKAMHSAKLEVATADFVLYGSVALFVSGIVLCLRSIVLSH